MIINSQNGIKYEYSNKVLQVFEELFIKPFEQHSITEAWQKEVIESYNLKNFKNIREIVGRGQADFDEALRGLTPEERVLVYCYDGNMQQHTVSQLYIFEKHANIFDQYIFELNKQIMFIDFGCGPLSSGIALALYYAESQKSNDQKLNFNYIGIDRAESMLIKAKNFSKYSQLFHSSATFDFFNNYKYPTDLKYKFYECIDSYVEQNCLIILNFSYFFASESLNVEGLILFIRKILSTYTSQNICLIFQNPLKAHLNHKWDLFKNGVQDLNTLIDGPLYEEFEFYDLQSKSQRPTRLYYDIRFRKNIIF